MLNEEKFKEWLKTHVDLAKRFEEDEASEGNYASALEHKEIATVYEFLLQAWETPEEFEFMEE